MDARPVDNEQRNITPEQHDMQQSNATTAQHPRTMKVVEHHRPGRDADERRKDLPAGPTKRSCRDAFVIAACVGHYVSPGRIKERVNERIAESN